MDENTKKNSKWKDRAFVALICWIAIFLIIVIAITVVVVRARSEFSNYGPQNNVVDENYLFVQLPSQLVQGTIEAAIFGTLYLRAICLIAIIILQIIPVIIKTKRVKKSFTILNCIFNLMLPVITVIPMIFVATTNLIIVFTIDIGLSIGLLAYVATWKCDKE